MKAPRKPKTAARAGSTSSLASGIAAPRVEDVAAEIGKQLGDASIPAIYRDKILTQRTRSYELRSPSKASQIEILHTLLGIELKMARRRLLCPDLATARYLSVFARLGCESVALPYDITQISRLADELESSWHRTLLLADHLTQGQTERFRQLVRRRLLTEMRQSVSQLGSGAKFPEFNQETRQRRK